MVSFLNPNFHEIFIHNLLYHGLRTHEWQLDYKFFGAKLITQIQMNISLECMKSFFCRKNSWLIQNQGLGRHRDKVSPKSATKNTENTPQFIWQVWEIGQNIWDVLEKTLLAVFSPMFINRTNSLVNADLFYANFTKGRVLYGRSAYFWSARKNYLK